MDESTQQIIALGMVAIVIAAEVLRRWRKNRKKSAGLNDPNTARDKKETPLKFYRRR